MIKGDGIGVDVSGAAMFLAKKAMTKTDIPTPMIVEIAAGASYFAKTGFALSRLRSMEIGGDMGTKVITLTLSSLMDGALK